ncbi:MAG: cytochrome P450, partial [Verrucomicrobiota bacterium]
MRNDILGFATETALKYGGISCIRVANQRVIFISRPEPMKVVLKQRRENFRKGKSYQKLRLLMGNGLLVADGRGWTQQRRLLQPHFTPSTVLGYREHIAECITNQLRRLENYVAKGEPIDLLS